MLELDPAGEDATMLRELLRERISSGRTIRRDAGGFKNASDFCPRQIDFNFQSNPREVVRMTHADDESSQGKCQKKCDQISTGPKFLYFPLFLHSDPLAQSLNLPPDPLIDLPPRPSLSPLPEFLFNPLPDRKDVPRVAFG